MGLGAPWDTETRWSLPSPNHSVPLCHKSCSYSQWRLPQFLSHWPKSHYVTSCPYWLKGQRQTPLCYWAPLSSPSSKPMPILREVILERRGHHPPRSDLSLWHISLRRESSTPELKELMKREISNCLQRAGWSELHFTRPVLCVCPARISTRTTH